jgi:hypothetical protein
MCYKVILIILLLLEVAIASPGQENHQSRIFVDAGLIGRTTVFYLHGLRDVQFGPLINTQYPYDYRVGVNGLGINVTPSLLVSRKAGIVIDWGSTLRYDFYYWNSASERVHTFYLDQSISFKKTFFTKFYIGVGFTVFNVGKELDYLPRDSHPPDDSPLQLQFNSIDFMSGIMVKRFSLK